MDMHNAQSMYSSCYSNYTPLSKSLLVKINKTCKTKQKQKKKGR